MNIGKVIRALRIERGLTQEQLALEAETATSNISRVENGLRTPSMALLQRVAVALGTSVSALHRATEEHVRLPDFLSLAAVGPALEGEDLALSYNRAGPEEQGEVATTDQWLSPSSLGLLKLYSELSPEHQHLALEYLRLLRRIQSEQDS